MQRVATTLCIMMLCAGSAGAESLSERISEAVDIPVEDWRDMAQGRTLTYRMNDEFFALERYARAGNAVTLQLANGQCLEGTWSYEAPIYCFDWGSDGMACFRHTRLGDDIYIVQTEEGADTANIQQMVAVNDVPVTCGPVVGS